MRGALHGSIKKVNDFSVQMLPITEMIKGIGNNTYSLNSESMGTNCIAGTGIFRVTGFTGNTVQLDSVEGLAVGDFISYKNVDIPNTVYSFARISSIDEKQKTIVLNKDNPFGAQMALALFVWVAK